VGAAFVFVAILLAAGMVLAAFQLGRLVTRDDEQREVDVARTRGMGDGVTFVALAISAEALCTRASSRSSKIPAETCSMSAADGGRSRRCSAEPFAR
jgi:hypothetical protein